MSRFLMRDYQRKHREALSKTMTRIARDRQCPSCRRKSAITVLKTPWEVIKVCRYCDHETGRERTM